MKILIIRGSSKLNILLIILVILLIIRLYIDNNCVKITSYEVESSKIPSSFNDYKIVQLSDLHNKKYGNSLIDKIDKISPDIIVMTGDMVSASDTNFDNFFNIAKSLVSKYKVYYIKGNHEGRMEKVKYDHIRDTLKKYGIVVLDNEKVVIEKENQTINLYGMWCNQRFYSRIGRDKSNVITKDIMDKILGESQDELYNILLMHTPHYLEAYADWGADLTLCGHIHGGVIRIPFIGGVLSPYIELFPEYCYGIYKYNDSCMIVNSGLCTIKKFLRLFNRPEVVVVTLKNLNNK